MSHAAVLGEEDNCIFRANEGRRRLARGTT